MDKDLNKLTKEFFDCLLNWNYEKITQMCNQNINWVVYAPHPIGGTYQGIDGIINLLKKLERKIPKGLTFIFKKIVIQSPFVAVEWIDLGLDNRGNSYKNRGMNFISFDEEGKIKEISEIVDSSVLN